MLVRYCEGLQQAMDVANEGAEQVPCIAVIGATDFYRLMVASKAQIHSQTTVLAVQCFMFDVPRCFTSSTCSPVE